MVLLRKSFAMIALLVLVAGCSTGGSEDVEAEGGEIDLEEIEELEEEFGVTEGDDAEIPSELPSDVYFADDMEIEYTVENDLMSQVRYKTEKSYEELKETYQDYLNSNSAFGEVTENFTEDEENNSFYAAFSTEFEENPLDILVYEDDHTEGYRMVDIAVYNEDVLDEMLDEMQEQMEED